MKKILILYHFYRPDDVVSSQQFAGLAEGLASKGWEVEAWPSNRSCHHLDAVYPTRPETLNGVLVHRVWRPAFPQHRFLGRIMNALWVEGAWKIRALLTPKKPDMVILGTDPIFMVLLSFFFRLLWPKTKIAHWCFDIYPEYAVAEGLVSKNNPLVRVLKVLLKKAYAACDLTADLGPCMRDLLASYPQKRQVTLTPWALEEPPGPMAIDPQERKNLFGEASLGLLYSGNLSHPHCFDSTLELARKTRGTAVFAFSARGNRAAELKARVGPKDSNVHFAAFAPPEKLYQRLSAPDIHVVSLRPSYTGVAVPSKFFGALAAGRPVLFEGDESSAIARWIKEYKVGWILKPKAHSSGKSFKIDPVTQPQDGDPIGNLDEITRELALFSGDPLAKEAMFKHCHEVYQAYFSKEKIIEGWHGELTSVLVENPSKETKGA